MRLVRGPFRYLEGDWRFTQLGEAGCRIDFQLAYQIASPLLERVVGPVFNHIANTFVDAFVRRADALHLRP
jgi:ribosome-associated toxin RatA of RatAB toxin-antitoxin module